MMRWPNISARVQTQPMIDVLVADVAEQVLIGRDTERRRAAAPFDLKTSAGFDFGKIADRPGVRDDVAVANDSAPTAAGGRQNQREEETDRSLIHNSTIVTDEMTSVAALDSRIVRGRDYFDIL